MDSPTTIPGMPDPPSMAVVDDPPESPILGQAAYHGLAGEYLLALDPYTEAGHAAMLAHFLSYAGCCFGAAAESPVLKWGTERHHPRIWAVVIGGSGTGGKGTSANPLLELRGPPPPPPASTAAEWECVNAGPLHPASPRLSLSSGEGLIAAIRDPVDTPNPKGGAPSRDPGNPDKRLFLVTAEFGGALAVMRREGNNLSAMLRGLWDGGPSGAMTKTNRTFVERPAVSIVGHITPAELHSRLDRDSLHNGLMGRFLWFHSERSKLIAVPGEVPPDLLDSIRDRLRAAVLYSAGKAWTAADFTAEAQSLWADEMVPRLTAFGDGLLGMMASRSRAYVLRIALLYALLDGSNQINAAHLRAAEAVWDYSLETFRQTFALLIAAGPQAANSDAEKVLAVIRRLGGKVTLGDLSEHSTLKNWTADRRRRAIDQLKATGQIEELAGEATNGGRVPTILRLTPNPLNPL